MSTDDAQPQSPERPQRIRRSSFAGQTFADLFNTGRPTAQRENTAGGSLPSQPFPPASAITSAAASAQRRRMSITTLGLNAANGQTSPFNSLRPRTDSFASANSGSLDENAVEDEVFSARESGSTPITRRTSFGARALRDIRHGSISGVSGLGGGGNVSPSQQNNGISSPSSSARNSSQAGTISSRDSRGRGEGFNWSDNFRTRAERTSSISGGAAFAASAGTSPSSRLSPHSRAKSVAVMEPPINEMPKSPREVNRPDHFQERILKGDFYMD